MSNWASKLQRKDSNKEGQKRESPKASVSSSSAVSSPPPPGSNQHSIDAPKDPKSGSRNEESDFNGTELSAYLAKAYASAVEEAKKDKSGENLRVYRSLESHSGWTKATTNKKEDRHMNIVTEVSRQIAQAGAGGWRARK